jgi:hypothetical protein
MKIESEMLDILRRYRINYISAVLDGGTARVRAYRRKTFDLRKYQDEHLIRARDKDRGNESEAQSRFIPTPDDLARAIVNAFLREGSHINIEDVRNTAAQIIQYFGFEREVIGNHLEPEETALMYQLEDMGLVNTRMEEYKLPNGSRWRVNFFVLNIEKIREYSSRSVEHDEASSVYGSLPEEAWVR